MKKLVFSLLFAATLLAACSSNSDFEKGKKQLIAMGYTEIVNTGHVFSCCGEDDSFSTGFKAKTKEGQTVEGCFCSSLFKGVTIRFE